MRRSAATHLSRLAADLARWTDEALGWADARRGLLDRVEHDAPEAEPRHRRARARKAARVAGDLVTVTALLQGLPLGYHRDLQEDKEPAFDAADTLELVLPAITGAVATAVFHVDAMRAACADEGLYATDLAEALVRDGAPFREAHRRAPASCSRASTRKGDRSPSSPTTSGRRSGFRMGRRSSTPFAAWRCARRPVAHLPRACGSRRRRSLGRSRCAIGVDRDQVLGPGVRGDRRREWSRAGGIRRRTTSTTFLRIRRGRPRSSMPLDGAPRTSRSTTPSRAGSSASSSWSRRSPTAMTSRSRSGWGCVPT